jgi:hypothetical protein
MSKLLQRLRDPKRSGVYRAPEARAILEATRGSDLDVVRIDAAQNPLEAISRTLEFPKWFGGNWDALEDSLADLSWRPRAGYVLLFEAYPPEQVDMLVDVLASVAQSWTEQGKPFFAVFIEPARKLELPDLYRPA